jgi:hypothetical protein
MPVHCMICCMLFESLHGHSMLLAYPRRLLAGGEVGGVELVGVGAVAAPLPFELVVRQRVELRRHHLLQLLHVAHLCSATTAACEDRDSGSCRIPPPPSGTKAAASEAASPEDVPLQEATRSVTNTDTCHSPKPGTRCRQRPCRRVCPAPATGYMITHDKGRRSAAGVHQARTSKVLIGSASCVRLPSAALQERLPTVNWRRGQIRSQWRSAEPVWKWNACSTSSGSAKSYTCALNIADVQECNLDTPCVPAVSAFVQAPRRELSSPDGVQSVKR